MKTILLVLSLFATSLNSFAGKLHESVDESSDDGSEDEGNTKRGQKRAHEDEEEDQAKTKKRRISEDLTPNSRASDEASATSEMEVVEGDPPADYELPAEIWALIATEVGPVDRTRLRGVSRRARIGVDDTRRGLHLTDTLPEIAPMEGFFNPGRPVAVGRYVLVVDTEIDEDDGRTLYVFDNQTMQLETMYPIDDEMGFVVFTPERVYITHQFDNNVATIDLETLVFTLHDPRFAYQVLPLGPARQLTGVIVNRQDGAIIAEVPGETAPSAHIGNDVIRMYENGNDQTTLEFVNPHTGNAYHTLHFALGALFPVLAGHYLLISEPSEGDIHVIDFRGHL